jgi:hypothetical protein
MLEDKESWEDKAGRTVLSLENSVSAGRTGSWKDGGGYI